MNNGDEGRAEDAEHPMLLFYNAPRHESVQSWTEQIPVLLQFVGAMYS